MNKKIIKILSTILICLIIFFFWRFIIKKFEEFRIDHECYMMSDKEFYSSEQCKPYWSYRQVGDMK